MTTETATAACRPWYDLAPMPSLDAHTVNVPKDLAAHYATMAAAHATAYTDVLRGFCAAQDRGDDLGPWGQTLRDAIRDHLEPQHAAFTAAALLHGLEPVLIVELLTDHPDVVDDLIGGWLPEGVDWPDIESAAVPMRPDTTTA